MSKKWESTAVSLESYAEPGRGGAKLTGLIYQSINLVKLVSTNGSKVLPLVILLTRDKCRRNLELSEKVVLVGDASVGKTSLILRLTADTFSNDYKSTIGVDFYRKKYNYKDYEFTLNVWDTAGQERFRSLSKAYYRGARAAIVAFDLGEPDTLNRAKHWVSEVFKENHSTHDVSIFLAGCKSDMFHNAKAEKVARELGAEYFEVSAKTGQNVEALFKRVATVMFESSLLRAADCKASEAEVKKAKKPNKIRSQPVMGGGKGLGSTGAGKGTENWKSVQKKSSGKSKIIKLHESRSKPPANSSCC